VSRRFHEFHLPVIRSGHFRRCDEFHLPVYGWRHLDVFGRREYLTVRDSLGVPQVCLVSSCLPFMVHATHGSEQFRFGFTSVIRSGIG
jgi:hypothetical protein